MGRGFQVLSIALRTIPYIPFISYQDAKLEAAVTADKPSTTAAKKKKALKDLADVKKPKSILQKEGVKRKLPDDNAGREKYTFSFGVKAQFLFPNKK